MILKKTPVVLGKAKFTVYTDGCIRMEYAGRKGFKPYPSVLFGGHNPRPVRAEVRSTGKTLIIRTPKMELKYSDDGMQFGPSNLEIRHVDASGQNVTWFPGKEDTGNFGTLVRSLDTWLHRDGFPRKEEQGLLSAQGGHLIEDDSFVCWNKEYQWPQSLSQNRVKGREGFDGYFFAYGSDFKSALADFIKVFGPIPMVPRWVFGFWYSKWHKYRGSEFVDLVKRYHREGIPIDVMIIDTDWRDNWGGYDWSRKYFPNPEKTLKQLHDLGVHTSLNDHPGYDAYDPLPPEDSHVPEIAGRLEPLPHQGQWACDWSSKKAVMTWRDVLWAPFFRQGVDFWWIDGWIKSPFGNMDGQLWANWQYYELSEEKTNKRGLILSRWGGLGSHRYPVQFSGDTQSDWQTLQRQIRFTADSGNLGAVYWSHDIGGFFEKRIEDELFIRWVQFGSLSPVFRTHSHHGMREPWNFGSRAKGVFKKQTRMRYALAPYFYTLAREAHDRGLPLARPLYLEYPKDKNAPDFRFQYLLGDQLLVIPADGPSQDKTGLFRKRAYFPSGSRWLALETSEIVEPKQVKNLQIPLERIPVYVKEGAIIPSQPVGKALGTAVPEELHLDCMPAFDCSSEFTLYEDDGESRGYEKKEFARTRIKARRTVKRAEVSVLKPRGSFTRMPKKRTYVIRVRLEPEDEIASVEIKRGSMEWQKNRKRVVSKVLACGIASGHRFCEVKAEGVKAGAVKVRINFE